MHLHHDICLGLEPFALWIIILGVLETAHLLLHLDEGLGHVAARTSSSVLHFLDLQLDSR